MGKRVNGLDTLASRFWSKVNKDGPIPAHRPELGPCWLWTGFRHKTGMRYGAMNGASKHRMEYAHRVAFYVEHGRWPRPVAMHLCDNPICVNPAHIKEATNAENVRDAHKQRRTINFTANPMHRPEVRARMTGERNPAAKITDEQVAIIRERVASGEYQRVVAAEFGLSRGHVGDICRGKKRR